MKNKMTQTPSRLSLRTATKTSSRRTGTLNSTLNALLRAGLGGALLALATACSGNMGAGSDELEGELDDQGSELADAFDSADVPGPAGVIEKATFNDNATFNGFDVSCTTAQKQLITTAEARARQILDIALPATADARVNRTSVKAGVFRTSFVPNASTNPDPNRTSPDEWDTAASRVAQKLLKVSPILASSLHTCHGDNESIRRDGSGAFRTCLEIGGNASTSFEGGAEIPVRWCAAGLEQDLGGRAVTLLHELIHQNRTADATGGVVIDDDSTGRLNNANNYHRWLNNNQP
jgi:hypothetical protein